MGTLYLVATPIGNLDDISVRALRTLADVPLIAAEDTRSARRLLDHFGVRAARLVSYNDHSKRARLPTLLAALNDGDVAVVSDAGMPGISDPGHDLVVAAVAAGHVVVPIPGASAVVAAVAASGLPSRRFHYLGFLPRQGGPRRAALRSAAQGGDTLVIFESPHRLRGTLADLQAALGDRRIAICRELTKLHEEIWRGSVSAALAHFAEPRGEFTIVVEGGGAASEREGERVEDVVRELRESGTSARTAVAEVARRCAVPRREAYRAWHAGAPED
ncbi:MAG: 16S rRNA (cytidine(1402)-2'-O)-methyltransferase [Dehalococcoidia bacterium]|nr:16S rRNA (cytidine(1402)-2'-O)-methyltransferase [Dehalococcoidia bacterium]